MAYLDRLDILRTAIAKEIRRCGVHPAESSWMETYYALIGRETVKRLGAPIWERQPKRWDKYKRENKNDRRNKNTNW